jgi:ribosomal protein S15P/S13E
MKLQCINNNNNNNKDLGIEIADKWYTHMPKPVYEEVDVTVLWNKAVHTDREVKANRPDIIIN